MCIQRLYGIFISSREKTGQDLARAQKSSGNYKVTSKTEEDPSSSEILLLKVRSEKSSQQVIGEP